MLYETRFTQNSECSDDHCAGNYGLCCVRHVYDSGTLDTYLARSRDVRALPGAAACTKLLCMRLLVATYYLPVSANAKRAAK